MEQPTQKPAAPAAPAPGGTMAPAAAPAQPAAAEMTQVVNEGLNIAVQAGLEAAQAAQQDPGIPEETRMKIEQGVVTLAEAQEEIQGAQVAPAPQPSTAGGPPGDRPAMG